MQDVRRPGQLGGAHPGGLRPHPVDLVGGEGFQQAAGVRVRNGRHHDQVAEPVEEIGREPARVVTGGDDLVDHGEQGRAVAVGQRVDGLVQQDAVGHAEQRHRPVVAQAVVVRAGQQLVENGQRVADRSGARPHDQRQHGRIDGDPLPGADRRQMFAQHARRNQPEGIVVRPGPDGRDDLVRFGGGEDELEVRRGLLDDLQQRVERRRGHHVRLVHHEDLEPGRRGGEERPLAQIAGVVDETVRRGVDLRDVH